MKYNEKKLLQIVVGLFGLIPICVGLSGVIGSISILGIENDNLSLDSHFRYLSGLLLAIGVGFYSSIPHIELKTQRMQGLTAIVFIGGLGRLIGLFIYGPPSLPMIGGLCMELVVTPLLCLWQLRVSHLSSKV
jgi:hypothetical protein